MGVLFISHSSQDNDQAIKVRDWLRSNGWGLPLELKAKFQLADISTPEPRWRRRARARVARSAASQFAMR